LIESDFLECSISIGKEELNIPMAQLLGKKEEFYPVFRVNSLKSFLKHSLCLLSFPSVKFVKGLFSVFHIEYSFKLIIYPVESMFKEMKGILNESIHL
jgi:hypothetical protein